MIYTLWSDAIDKVFVFLRPDGSVSFVLPWINFDYLYIAVLVCITLAFIFDVFCIFVAHWRKH